MGKVLIMYVHICVYILFFFVNVQFVGIFLFIFTVNRVGEVRVRNSVVFPGISLMRDSWDLGLNSGLSRI